MGCGSSSQAVVVDQNQNLPPAQPPAKQPPPQVQPEPKKTPVQPVAPQQRAPPPPKEPTPPPPKKPTPPPPKEATPPPPKEPTPPPPKEATPEPPKAEDGEKLTPEILKEFVEYEKSIQKLERKQPEERLMLLKFELKNTEDSVKIKSSELEAAKAVAIKEYADYANFDIQEYMTSNQISYLSPQDADAAFNKEKQEYLEAKNKVDSFQKEIDRLNSEIISLNEKVSQSHLKVEELQTLQDKQDGLLENLFNGDYGSELEDKLEAEHEEMRSTRDRLVLVAMKWRSCKDALSKVCSQFSYSVARWTQLQEYPNIPNVAKYYMATETRNALIAGHMNIRYSVEQAQMALPYWNNSDDKNLVMSVNIVYNDLATQKTFARALAWYKYYHWRVALSLNWAEQVIAQIHQQFDQAEKTLGVKYQDLKKERLCCIQSKLKEKLDVDLDIEELLKPDIGDDENEDLFDSTVFDVDNTNDVKQTDEMPEPKENLNPTSLEAIAADVDEGNEEKKEDGDEGEKEEGEKEEGDTEKAAESEEKPAGEGESAEGEAESASNEEGGEKKKPEQSKEEAAVDDGKPKAPPIKTIPLEELAPLPSQEELLNKVEQLMQSAEDAEVTLEKNKLKQEQQLQEQLRRRRSRRKRVRDQTQNNVQVAQSEVIPESDEPKPEIEESKPESEEAKPESEETKPESEEAKPESEETKPESEEAKPESEEAKPESEEAKPESEEAKPESEEAKPESEETKLDA